MSISNARHDNNEVSSLVVRLRCSSGELFNPTADQTSGSRRPGSVRSELRPAAGGSGTAARLCACAHVAARVSVVGAQSQNKSLEEIQMSGIPILGRFKGAIGGWMVWKRRRVVFVWRGWRGDICNVPGLDLSFSLHPSQDDRTIQTHPLRVHGPSGRTLRDSTGTAAAPPCPGTRTNR